MDILKQPIEEVFTEERTKALGFTYRMQRDFLTCMHRDISTIVRRIYTIEELIGYTPARLNRRTGFGPKILRYMIAVLESVGINYP